MLWCIWKCLSVFGKPSECIWQKALSVFGTNTSVFGDVQIHSHGRPLTLADLPVSGSVNSIKSDGLGKSYEPVYFTAILNGQQVKCMTLPSAGAASSDSVNVVMAYSPVSAPVDVCATADMIEGVMDDMLDPSIAFALSTGRSVPVDLLYPLESEAAEFHSSLPGINLAAASVR